MTVACVADLQFDGRNVDVLIPVLERIIEEDMKPQGVDWIVACGDIFEYGRVGDRYKPASYIVSQFSELIHRMGIPWIVVAGNHDLDASGYCGLDLLRDHDLVQVASEPCSFAVEDVGVVCLPWFELDSSWLPEGINIREKCRKLLKNLQKDVNLLRMKGCTHILLAAHVEVEGACMPNGVLLRESRYAFSEKELQSVGADWEAIGHIHKPQYPYIGSLWHKDFGESGIPCCWQKFPGNETLASIIIPVPPEKTVQYVTLDDYQVDFADMAGVDLLPDPVPSLWKIRFLGTNLPPELEKLGIRPFRSTEQIVLDRRTDKPISFDSQPLELLKLWLENSGEIPPNENFWDFAKEIIISESYVPHGQLERLISLELEGFGKFERLLRIEFGDRLVIFGPVGSGKSLILESIYAALFGRWPHSGRDTLNEMVNSSVEARMELVFRASGQDWMITRKIKNGSQTDVKLVKLTGGIEVFKGPDAVRKHAEVLVGPPNLFLATVFLSQEGVGDLITATPYQRMDLIRQLLGADRFETIYKNACERVQELQQDISRLENVYSNDKEEKLRVDLETEIKLFSTGQIRYQKVQAARDEKKSELDRLAVVNTEPEKLKNRLGYLEQQKRPLDKIAKDLREKLQRVKDHELYDSTKVQFENVKKALNLAKVRQKLHREVKELRVIEEPLERAGCAEQGYLPCPFLDLAHKARLKLQECLNELPDVDQQFEKIAPPAIVKLDDPTELLSREVRDIGKLLRDWTELRNQEAVLIELSEENQKQIEATDRQIQETKTLLASIQNEDFQELKEEVRLYETDMIKLSRELGASDARINVYRRNLDEMEANREKVEELRPQLAAFRSLQQAFGRTGIPQLLIDSALPAIQKIVNEICLNNYEQLFEVLLDTQKQLKDGSFREAFSIRFRQNDREYDASSCSGGERTAIRGILRQAIASWIRGGGKDYVSLQDEPTAAQDEHWKTMTMNMFREQAETCGQVVVVTHDQEMLLEFGQRVVLQFSEDGLSVGVR